MRVLITGGTGLLGNTVVRQLHQRGDQVLTVVRSEPHEAVFDDLPVDIVHCHWANESAEADSRKAEQNTNESDLLEQCIERCDAVIHCAALIHLGWTRLQESLGVNRDGTKRIAALCRKLDKKLILVGTVDTLAVGSPQVLANEDTPLEHAGGQVPCAYVQSKRASVQAVQEEVQKGLKAVIVHPGFMLGPWDWKPSSGRMMLEIAKSWKPVSPSGGCSFCDSRDVAAGVIAALDRDLPSGREFILAGHNWTYHQLWTEMARRVGTRPPLRAAGPGMQYLAGLAGDLWTKLSGREVDLNSAGVQMSAQYHWYDSKRAANELGYQTRPPEETLDAAADWILQRFILPGGVAGG